MNVKRAALELLILVAIGAASIAASAPTIQQTLTWQPKLKEVTIYFDDAGNSNGARVVADYTNASANTPAQTIRKVYIINAACTVFTDTSNGLSATPSSNACTDITNAVTHFGSDFNACVTANKCVPQ